MRYTLKAKRIERGIKQGDFARQLGISRQLLNSIEMGKSEPRRSLMVKMATVLNEDVLELFFNNNK
ncbi:MAG: transcriptional regulator [Clostridiaceae bacterium]|jgi:putative transcriptional regulator|nr:transcriptional regulator [Clostridiaceae bacterium]